MHKKLKTITVADLPVAPNVCQQELREVWRTRGASLAHVIMAPRTASLRHKHLKFTELYYILAGSGMLHLDTQQIFLAAGMAKEVPPGVAHHLRNTGDVPLVHLVLCEPAFDSKDVVLLEE